MLKSRAAALDDPITSCAYSKLLEKIEEAVAPLPEDRSLRSPAAALTEDEQKFSKTFEKSVTQLE